MMQLFGFVMVCVLVGCSFAFPFTAWTQKTADLVFSMLRGSDVLKEKNSMTIPKLAESMGMTEYVKYMTMAKMMTELESTGPFTAFGPTNGVFEGLHEYVKSLLANQTTCEHLMMYSVMKGKLMESEIKNNLMMPTLMGGENKIRFNTYKNKVMTASGRVMTMPGKTASNGMLFEVMGLLQPPVPRMAKSFALCPIYKMLSMAIETAGMEEMLMGDGPFTMFAPTDEAFEKIPEETRAALMKNTTALKELLMYHLVDGAFYTPAWDDKEEVTTKSGKTITIEQENGKWMVNSAEMTVPDTTCINGVVHVINAVLMPPTARIELVL